MESDIKNTTMNLPWRGEKKMKNFPTRFDVVVDVCLLSEFAVNFGNKPEQQKKKSWTAPSRLKIGSENFRSSN
jgi:hypothetical protein